MFGSGLRLGAIAVPVSLALLILAHRNTHRPIGVQPRAAEVVSSPIYFSPATNLEEVDLSLIERAEHSIDVAMYSFTDRRLAMALRRAAERGVTVRIYRDHEQYEEELRRGSTVSSLLAGEPHIEVKVKQSDELMHEKAMLCDDMLRSGSGNWSVSAARYQDNEITVTTDAAEVAAFAREFRAMWERPDNRQVR
jgi:phosphatidylserine/phosphatidylglycerophosphate/cardiolipin synthase-like enzyme